jgi:hypothetical protein
VGEHATHDRIGITEHVDLPGIVTPEILLTRIVVPKPPQKPQSALVNDRPRRDCPLRAPGREKIEA